MYAFWDVVIYPIDLQHHPIRPICTPYRPHVNLVRARVPARACTPNMLISRKQLRLTERGVHIEAPTMKSRPDILFKTVWNRRETQRFSKHVRIFFNSRYLWRLFLSTGFCSSRYFSCLPADSCWKRSMSGLDFMVRAYSLIPLLDNPSFVATIYMVSYVQWFASPGNLAHPQSIPRTLNIITTSKSENKLPWVKGNMPNIMML
jgi:hypothetical protein